MQVPCGENYVVSQWLRWRDWFHSSIGIWYWRDQQGNEVDLLLEVGQKIIAIECKLKEKPIDEDIRGIEKLRDFYSEKIVIM